MLSRLTVALILVVLPIAPAMATQEPSATPEPAVGLGALLAMGVGYAWMRGRAKRN